MRTLRGLLTMVMLAFQFDGLARSDMKIAVPILSGHFDMQADGRSAAALRTIFSACDVDYSLFPHRWGQHWQVFESDPSYDAVAIVWDSAGVDGFPSDDFIHQKNGVAYLASRNLEFETVEDLAGLRVLGFSGATELFPGLADVMPTLQSYWEAPPGFASRLALVNGDVDVFITDGLIFAIDYMQQVKLNGASYGDENWPEMKFTGLFPEIGDRMHFRDEDDRDQFNRCLKEAQESGAIAAATKPYVDPYRMIVGDSVPKQ